MSLYCKFLDWAGLGDMNRRHREWRRQQIALELEEAHLEVAQLAAWIGKLQREKSEIERDLND
jgi:hypothetical protein